MFISNEQSKKIVEWEKTHPKESELYWKKASDLTTQFMSKQISYDTFKFRLNEAKEEYHFLEG